MKEQSGLNQVHFPLSPNQKRLWIISQEDKFNPQYNLALTYHIKGEINTDIFIRSLETYIHNNNSFFSTFKQSNNDPYLIIKSQKINVEFHDFSGTPLEDHRKSIFSFISTDIRKIFDIEKGPLFRLWLLKENNQSYYFHATIHHLIFDGSSYKILAEELSAIYTELIKGSNVVPNPSPFKSYDFSHIDKISDAEEEESIKFWKENLMDAKFSLKSLHDFAIKKEPSGLGRIMTFKIPSELTKKIRSISHEEGSSVFKTLLGTIAVLMHKYTSENDVCLGFPISQRRLCPQIENIIGFFVSTSVARIKNETDFSFKELVLYAKEVTQKAIINSRLPFDKIVEAANPERTGRNPLFQVSLTWRNKFFKSLDLGGIEGERIRIRNTVASDDIAFYMWEDGDIIRGEIEYDIDIFRHETIFRLKENYLNLVKILCMHPDKRINSISLITPAELKLINEVNNTRTNYPKDKVITELFEQQVNLFPNKKALIFKNDWLSYQQLNEKSNQLAHKLRELGIGANSLVAIYMEKSVNMFVAIFGILKAGGAYVPIDPEYPEQRTSFIISDSGCKTVLTQTKYLGISFNGITKINIEDKTSYLLDISNPKKINSPLDLAYVIYTSGTTGTPKGSLIPQRGVVRLVCNTNYIEFKPEDNVLQTSAIVFDASTEEIFGALLNGSSLFIIDKATVLDPTAFGIVLDKNNITIVDLASALFTQIAEMRTDVFSKVNYLVLGGDVVSAPHVNRVRKNNPHIKILNTYGPTENSCNSTAYTIDREFEYNIPIGKPISNSTAYIFDKYLNYQPIGVTGELYVGGDGLSLGYLNREDLNKSSFIEDPYHPGDRLYKTGDLARWLPDGNIEFHGRIDNQIKIRGYRVEIEEIESVISNIEGVIETVIKPVKVDEGEYKLIAFINIKENASIDSKQINRIIKDKLPIYMVPSAYKFMHGFPKNINGKIDRKLLTFDSNELQEEERKEIRILSPTEETLLIIWNSILKTNNILSTDSFFDVGGSSLLVLKCLNKINEHFDVNLTFGEFLINPILSQLAWLIDLKNKENNNSIKLIHTKEITNLPLTGNQKRLYLLSILNPEFTSYNLPFIYKITGKLNLEILQKSLEILFNRHSVVFSVFKIYEGNPVCDIIQSKVTINITDLRNFEENEKQLKIENSLNQNNKKLFDLNTGPLFMLNLIHSADEEYYFHFIIHHIIFDGWSWPIFVHDLRIIYKSLLDDKKAILEDIEFHQFDFAIWENKKESADFEKPLIEFWKENLKGVSNITNFPFDFKRKKGESISGNYELIKFPKDLTYQIRTFSLSKGISLFSFLLSVFGIEIYKYSDQEDFNIGSPVAYRPHSKLENIFGMFVNTILFRLKYENNMTVSEIINQTNQIAINTITNQNLPFEKVVELAKPDRSSNITPLFQFVLAWQNNLEVTLSLEGTTCEEVYTNQKDIPFDFILNLWESEDHIEGKIDYNSLLFKQTTISEIKDNFIFLTGKILNNINCKVSDLEFSSVIKTRNKLITSEVQIPEDSIESFLIELKNKKIKIWFVNDKLKFSGPEYLITAELINKLRLYKEKLKHYY